MIRETVLALRLAEREALVDKRFIWMTEPPISMPSANGFGNDNGASDLRSFEGVVTEITSGALSRSRLVR